MTYRLICCLLFVGSLLFFVVFNGGTMLYGYDEARNAGCAREMLLRHDFVVPVFNGQLRTDKPPLHYYLMIGAYQWLGVTEFAARLGSALMGALVVLMTFIMANRQLGRQVAWGTVVVLLAAPHVSVQFRMAVPDPYLIAALTLVFWAGYEALTTGRAAWAYTAWLAIGLGLLAKGPVAVALPMLVWVAYAGVTHSWATGGWKVLWRLKPLTGPLLMLAVALPWYIAVHARTNGAWTAGFWLRHNVGRFTNPMEGHGGFIGLPLLYVFIGLLPLGFFMPQALAAAWRSRHTQPFGLYSLSVLAVTVGFFMLSQTKLPNYTVPAYPFIAVLLGTYLTTAVRQPLSGFDRISWRFLVGLALLMPVGLAIALTLDPALMHLTADSLWFSMTPIAAIGAVYLMKKRQADRAVALVATSFMLLILAYFGRVAPHIDQQNPIRALLPLLPSNAPVAGYQYLNPAFVFYSHRTIPLYEEPYLLRPYLASHPNAYIISRSTYTDELSHDFGLTLIRQHRNILEQSTATLLHRIPTLTP